MARSSALGFGITAGERPWLATLGSRIESLGFDELWANDGRGRSGLATLRACASDAPRLVLGVGVIPLSERSPDEIATELGRTELASERMIVGVGSGRSTSLALVRQGVGELRGRMPDLAIAVAAVGPRMCRAAGAIADVVLLNWATPPRLEQQRRLVADGAAEAARPMPRLAAYIRVAVGPDAHERLRAEQGRYAGYGEQYRRAMDEQRGQAVGIAAADPMSLRRQLNDYRPLLDTCIVRGLPAADRPEEWLAIAEAAAD